MRIAMIGSGYVGLVSGACFAQFGHDVACIDKDAGKIDRLRRGEIPIYEPGLDRLVADNTRAGRLEFGTNLTDPKDAPWFKAITQYMAGDLNNDGTTDIPAVTKGVSWTFWSWNPDSGDTGGILANDWQTVNQNKLQGLTPLMSALPPASGAGVGKRSTTKPKVIVARPVRTQARKVRSLAA